MRFYLKKMFWGILKCKGEKGRGRARRREGVRSMGEAESGIWEDGTE